MEELRSVLEKVWTFLKDPENWGVLVWFGGSVVVVVTGIWAVLKFLRRGGKNKEPSPRGISLGAESSSPTVSAPPSPSRTEPSFRLDENVQFTVFRPKMIAPDPAHWYSLLCFAHLAERRPDAPPDSPDPVERVRQEAEAELSEQMASYRQLVADATQAIPEAGQISIVPEVPGLEFNPPSRSFQWHEDVHKEVFRFRSLHLRDGSVARGTLTIRLGVIIVASLDLSIPVRAEAEETETESAREFCRTYRQIFPSYSHRDRQIVDHIIECARAIGSQYLQDVIALRSGEPWREQLHQLIRGADLFQLFWSRNAMHSPNVRDEWELALSLRRPGFIRPTYWETPLPKDKGHGLPPPDLDALHFHRVAIPRDLSEAQVRHGAAHTVDANTDKVIEVPCEGIPDEFIQGETPTAGLVYELEGPDAQAVIMPPAPDLLDASAKPNPELAFEIAEVYEFAVLRDQQFCDFEEGAANAELTGSLARLNALPYVEDQTGRPRRVATEGPDAGQLTAQTVFRGSSPGVWIGPYLSQFLLIGNTDRNRDSVADGKIGYGELQVDQRVPVLLPQRDYMLSMVDCAKVRRGLNSDPKEDGDQVEKQYGAMSGQSANATGPAPRRFISTPRDLASYVHHDALYEPYLNACLILLTMETPFDPVLDQLSSVGAGSKNRTLLRNDDSFAIYGGPHILTLVTEAATRALKAVRFQKSNNHNRLRPEALAARIELMRTFGGLTAAEKKTVTVELDKHIDAHARALACGTGNGTLKAVSDGPGKGTHLLPMAFPAGSAIHSPAGAGRATAAGACVTILKAVFDTNCVLVEAANDKRIVFKSFESGDTPVQFRAPALPGPGVGEGIPMTTETPPQPAPLEMTKLDPTKPETFLTLEGELNKLATNVCIGRCMAGVDYFSYCYDGLRMGEQIAIGILQEQALTYSTDPFVLSVPSFDGKILRI